MQSIIYNLKYHKLFLTLSIQLLNNINKECINLSLISLKKIRVGNLKYKNKNVINSKLHNRIDLIIFY